MVGGFTVRVCGSLKGVPMKYPLVVFRIEGLWVFVGGLVILEFGMLLLFRGLLFWGLGFASNPP